MAVRFRGADAGCMTTHNAFTNTPSTSAASTPAAWPGGPVRRRRASRVLRALRAVVRFYRANWERAAAQESEYLRLREENLRKYWEASAGRM